MDKARVLFIDLATNNIEEKEIDFGPWMGGRGLAVKIFTDLCDPDVEPLSPGNVFVVAVSPLTGTAAPTSGRGHMVFKSPLTGAIGSANSGGRWGKVMKASGYDAMVITGASEKPVYVTVSDEGEALTDRVKVLDAEDLWGMTVPEASDELAGRHGDVSVLATGPAGENLVRYAALMNEKNRAYGRGGPGAVLGSKKVKAVVVRGSKKTEVADRARLNDAVSQTLHTMKAQPVTKRVLRDLGTAGLVRLIDTMEMLPHKNFRDCAHNPELLRRVSGEAISKKILERAGGCYGCPILCQRHTRIGDRKGEGPEYETVVLMGPVTDVYDLERVTLGNYEANELGLDTISLGGTVACACELVEKGAIANKDLGGVELGFGKADMYPEIVKMIGARQGIGDLLAEGSLRLAKKFGMPETAMQVKGLELPAYDPRGMYAQALGYMTSPTGACHLRGGYSVSLAFFGGFKEVPRFSIRQAPLTVKNQQDLGIIQDSLGVCRFTGYAVGAEHWARVISAVAGRDIGKLDLERSAEIIADLERSWNMRAGFGREHDELPARFSEESVTIDGKERIISPEVRKRLLDDFYSVRGWDSDGSPRPERAMAAVS